MSYLCKVKNVILILISVLMFTKPLWPVVDYIANYDYIVNVLCENIDKPELECDGKCYLSKELAKEAGADDANPLNSKTSKTEIPQVIISENLKEYEFVSQTDHISIQEIGYLPNLHSLLLTSSIYHPPQLG
ncbi:hypothetical protein [Aequorivita xiaoshiensis]|uniref:Uncharacterized protein n=1 Tax=Aequorivita xiaoshiensis TaxID=2874476 RepID=A0A9X1U626_9FLAO|nr:hypothetical protein [Aequorivita xiaoshiensis]MCG2431173.1 hypothetical protein [Aequorivita xiaoshiensis]